MDEREGIGFEGNSEQPQFVYNETAKAAYEAAGAAVPGEGQPAEPAAAEPRAASVAAQAPAQPKDSSKKRGLIIGVVVVVIVAVLFWVNSCVNSAVSSLSSVTNPFASQESEITTDSVAVIELSGEIAYDGSACSPEGFKELLDRAEANPHVKAVVLRVNSGGGVATAGEEMTEYLKEFSKPVVVSSAALNASAAYEISSQADCIFVARSTAIGSIGTAMQLVDYSGLMELLGIKTENITSSGSKDSTYGTRSLTDEERAQYQHQVDQINQVFLENVSAGRSMEMDKVRALATGMTYTGVDAVENGLADEIGTLEDACQKAAQLAGVRQYDIAYLDLGSVFSLENLLSMNANVNISSQDVVAAIKELK